MASPQLYTYIYEQSSSNNRQCPCAVTGRGDNIIGHSVLVAASRRDGKVRGGGGCVMMR